MKENKMEVMEMKKLLFTMAFPIIISMVIQSLYNIVDSMFVARISNEALMAVSLCYPVQTIMIAVACGTGVGINAMLSRYLGQKEGMKANAIAWHGIVLSLCNGLFFALFGIFFTNAFLSLFTKNTEVIHLGISYLTICCGLSFTVFVQITYERFMQATGHSFYNMIMQGIGALLNIVLDPIFIFGFHLGVRGAAIATVIGQFVAMLIGIWIVVNKVNEIHVHPLSLDGYYFYQIYKIGIPAILIQSILSFMTVFMNMILVSISSLAVSVFGIYFKMEQFVYMAISGLNNALIPIVSYNYGAQNSQRIQEAIRYAICATIGIMLIGTFLFECFPSQLLSCFNAEKEMFEMGIPCLRICSLAFVCSGISVTICSILQSINRPNESLCITLLRQMILLIPLAYFMMYCFGLEIGWFSFPITEVICMFISIYLYKRKSSD